MEFARVPSVHIKFGLSLIVHVHFHVWHVQSNIHVSIVLSLYLLLFAPTLIKV